MKELNPHPLIVAMGSITVAAANDLIGIIAGLAALGYTIWRWRKDAREKK